MTDGRGQRDASMAGKTCLVTGATAGIGREAAVGLARKGARIVLVARDRARGEATTADVRARGGNEDVSLLLADLASQESIRKLAAEVERECPRLDVLVNNAGAIFGSRELSPDGIEMTFALNHLGYFLLTNLLVERLRASAPARVVNVASEAHRSGRIEFEDLQGDRAYSGWKAYGNSKLANIVFTYELARRLAGTGVTANCLHPGVVATNFGKSGSPLFRFGVGLLRPFFRSSAKGAATTVYLASSPEVEGVTGKYFMDEREARSIDASYDEGLWRHLWDVSEEMTGLPSRPL